MKKILYLVLVAVLAAAVPAWGQNNQTYTLGKIPAGWTVKANGNTVTVTDSTAIIPAGATVTLTPTYPAKVKSVKLKDEGLLNGKFTINAGGTQVYFSQGNLQAVCSSADNDASTQETWTWQFATNQWDYVGYSIANASINGNGSVSTTGTVDLFGWVGTSSSYDNYGIHNNTTASYYGNTSNESLKHDWGHNAIANGGNSADMWRTLTRDEWWYMLKTRSGATVNETDKVRFAKATIRTDETAVKGLLLFPDGVTFDASEASWGVLNDGNVDYTTTCTAAQWTALEAKGCVFLPAASIRTGATVSNESSIGAYWTATGSNQSGYYTWAHMVYFNTNTWSTSSSYKEKSYGLSVRLVKVVPHAVDLSTLTGDYEAQDGDILINTLAGNYKITIADRATVTLDGVSINADGNWTSGNYAGITCLGDATIVLEGTNTVKGFHHYYPGIQAAHNGTGSGDEYTLTIKGDGSLTASSNYSGDFCAAGIGAGYNHACGNILIESGTIVAESVYHGAGIGGATYASCGTITITGGTVTATCGQYGAGIGSGSATTSNPSEFCAAITITGGTVTAIGGEHGAGIGSGYKGKCQSISITGGTVIATGYGGGAGVGSGKDGSCSTITIADGVTQVTATKGSDATNSIGAGNNGSCGTITIDPSLSDVTSGNTRTISHAPSVPTGAIDGLFSVSSTKQVYFSKGNLQAVGTTSSSPSSGWTWQFAENQYDYIGGRSQGGSEAQTGNNYINDNGTLSANGTVDLFCWSTNATYYGIHNGEYSSTYSGDFYDWGNAIGSGWRTPTPAEWEWLLGPSGSPTPGTNCRTSSTVNGVPNARYAKATVAGKAGLIIFPDSYTHPGDVTAPASVNTPNAAYTDNNYDATAWGKMEAAGAVFLPAAGNSRRVNENNIVVADSEFLGFYWSTVPYVDEYNDKAYQLVFFPALVEPLGYSTKNLGMSVRLVKDVQ